MTKSRTDQEGNLELFLKGRLPEISETKKDVLCEPLFERAEIILGDCDGMGCMTFLVYVVGYCGDEFVYGNTLTSKDMVFRTGNLRPISLRDIMVYTHVYIA